MSEQQRPERSQEAGQEPQQEPQQAPAAGQTPPGGEQQQPPAPPPWPTLGADYREAPTPPPPPPPPSWESAPWGQAADQRWQPQQQQQQQQWQPPPQGDWSQPQPASWNQPVAVPRPTYPGARIPDSEARTWAVVAHLSPLAAAFVGLPFLGPLVVWLLKREAHPYVAEQAREALNFNLSMFIYAMGAAISIIFAIGILLLPALLVAWFVLGIVGAVKAGNGEPYRYPLTIRMVN